MPLHRVHTQDEMAGDLAVGGALKQQAQHVALALSERLSKRTRVRRGGRKSRGLLLTESGEQRGDVIRQYATCIRLAQQDQHR